MRLSNRTDAKCLALPVKARDGGDQVVVIVKYTYRIEPPGRLVLEEDGVEPRVVDVASGDDLARSSIRYPSDLFDAKPGTDVLLVGHAHAPRGATWVDVSLRAGPVAKAVRAHGLRVYQRGAFGGVAPGPARPIGAPIPLVYELAYGGADTDGPGKPAVEPRNPLGRGVARNPASLLGIPAHQLELRGGGGDVPAAFGAVHRHWQPRARFAGTYDDLWMMTRMPLLPADFDARFYVCVAHDQWAIAPLEGGTPVEIVGACASGPLRFELPRRAPALASLCARRRSSHYTYLDTLLVDTDALRLELTWRAAVPVHGKLETLDEIRVTRSEGASDG